MLAGLHVPVIPLFDIAGKAGATEFSHSGPIAVKTGVIWLATVISIEVAVPHCAPSGVNA